jgi:hypothetical protein
MRTLKVTTYLPMALTLLLLVWTALVYKASHYVSWQIDPALAILPLVAGSHIVLIVRNKPRAPFILYALVHLAVLIPVWIGCLMLISHDSL